MNKSKNYFKIISIIVLLFFIILLLYYSNSPGSIPTSNSINNNTNQRPGKCLIVEEKYCNSFKLITSPFSNIKNSFAAFKLPKGTVIFSPIDGYASNESNFTFKKDQKNQYPGITISFPDSNIKDAKTFYSFSFYELNKNTSKTVKTGDIIGTVSEKKIDAFVDYNLIFYITDRLSEKEDIQKLNQLLK